MKTFGDSSWAKEDFSKKYLERADIYIVERRKMFRIVASFFGHFFEGRTGISLLDLGCGDGVFTEELLKIDDRISATLVDGSEAMLQRARQRLEAYRCVHFIRASFQEILDNGTELPEVDLCLSSQAIHHLEMKDKASLFRYIHTHLKAGGCFVNVDVVRAPSKEVQEWYLAMWRDWMGEMFGRFRIDDELPQDIIKRYEDPASMNRPDTLEAQLEALRDAGFRDVDCYYKHGIFVIFGGRKA